MLLDRVSYSKGRDDTTQQPGHAVEVVHTTRIEERDFRLKQGSQVDVACDAIQAQRERKNRRRFLYEVGFFIRPTDVIPRVLTEPAMMPIRIDTAGVTIRFATAPIDTPPAPSTSPIHRYYYERERERERMCACVFIEHAAGRRTPGHPPASVAFCMCTMSSGPWVCCPSLLLRSGNMLESANAATHEPSRESTVFMMHSRRAPRSSLSICLSNEEKAIWVTLRITIPEEELGCCLLLREEAGWETEMAQGWPGLEPERLQSWANKSRG